MSNYKFNAEAVHAVTQQIRADIAKRKAMPPFGVSPDASLERLHTIQQTQRSFNPETVEMLLATLDSALHTLADGHETACSLAAENEDLKFLIHASGAQTLTTAAIDVLAERQRQQSIKGFSTQQDDTYIGGELAAAAISYIEPMEAEAYWPADWHDNSFKPSDYRRNLVKACALLIAEIERVDRQQEGG